MFLLLSSSFNVLTFWISPPVVGFAQDNAVLYCIGDVNVNETEEQIRQMFGHLGGVPNTTVSYDTKLTIAGNVLLCCTLGRERCLY